MTVCNGCGPGCCCRWWWRPALVDCTQVGSGVQLGYIGTGSTGSACWSSGLGGSALTWALADWTPAAGLAGQTLSIVARLGIAYTVDILLWCFLLGLVAYYLDDPL